MKALPRALRGAAE